MQETIVLPTSYFISLLLNDRRKAFTPNDQANHLEKNYIEVEQDLAETLKTKIDPDEQLVHVEFPGPYNDCARPQVWKKSAWLPAYERKRKEAQAAEARRYASRKRDEKIRELAKAISSQLGFDDSPAGQSQTMALTWAIIQKRNVAVAKIYGVDISMLTDEVTRQVEIVGDIVEHFR